LNMPYGKVGGGRLPTKVDMPNKHPEVPGFKTVKVRYGPYKVPNMNVVTRTLTGPEEGALWNYPDMNIQKPCTECMIVGIMPDYEDLEGNSVNVDTGAWLHHIVLLSSNGRGDPTCASKSNSLPHWVVGHTASSSERFFASGNERTTVHLFDQNITDAGYKVNTRDSFAMIVDLMNMNKQDSTLYVVIHYDIIEGKYDGLNEIKPIWLDVDQCGFSEAKARSQAGSYNIASVPWRSNVDGQLLVMGGHIHDGGIRAIIKADGKVVCDSKAGYGESSKYISGAMGGMAAPKGKAGGEAGHGHSTGGQPHISSMVLCWKGHEQLKTARIASGQVWTVEAQYDYKQFAGATHPDGKQENVMGIGVIWVKKDKK